MKTKPIPPLQTPSLSTAGSNRRTALKTIGLGMLGGGFSSIPLVHPTAQEAVDQSNQGVKPLKITRVKAILTAPQRSRLVVVKVETNEPGLYGLGCATFTQRAWAVVTAVNEYLDDFARGRNPDDIEDMWQNAYTSSYWRNGPVLNNALSGLDQALWDIKGKRAGMPVYQLLGGKTRFAVDCYAHASGRSLEDLAESVQRHKDNGFRHIRLQLGGYGSPHLAGNADFKDAGFGLPSDSHMSEGAYLRTVPKMFEFIRSKFGEELEFLHDVHERVPPIEAIRMIEKLEPFRPFFIEDPFPPEANGYFKLLRQHTSVPIAMGELFNNPHEWLDLISGRLIDFIRVHLSQIGGLTPARKLATLCEWFQVRTAWHGPGDVSPVGHAANAHLDFAIPNFGIQESVFFNEAVQEVFSGCPYLKNGYMHVNEAPGFGVDIDEQIAAKFPAPDEPDNWRPLRRTDGSAIRP